MNKYLFVIEEWRSNGGGSIIYTEVKSFSEDQAAMKYVESITEETSTFERKVTQLYCVYYALI